MVLNLLPVAEHSAIEDMQGEIRILADEPKPKTPLIHEWSSDNKDQTITHVATGCQFHAYPIKPPLISGLVVPFGRPHEIAVRFIGMKGTAALSELGRVRELGREGIAWVLAYTFEAGRGGGTSLQKS